MSTKRVQITIDNVTDSEHLAEVLEDLIFDIEHDQTGSRVHTWNDGVVQGRCELVDIADKDSAKPVTETSAEVPAAPKYTVSLLEWADSGANSLAVSRVLRHLNKQKLDDQPVPITKILDSVGLTEALWCAIMQDAPEFKLALKRYAAWCVLSARSYAVHDVVTSAAAVACYHAEGTASDEQLNAATAELQQHRDRLWDLVNSNLPAARLADAALGVVSPDCLVMQVYNITADLNAGAPYMLSGVDGHDERRKVFARQDAEKFKEMFSE